MSLLQDLEEDIAEHRRPTVFEAVGDVVTMLAEAARARTQPPVVSLNMHIAYREEFRGGWVLWLGNSDVARLSADIRAKLSSTTFERRAKHFFRLSLWTRPGGMSQEDITEIPDGAEVMVARVTGLRLYDNMAQGNTSRVELVVLVDDDDIIPSDEDAPNARPPDVVTPPTQPTTGSVPNPGDDKTHQMGESLAINCPSTRIGDITGSPPSSRHDDISVNHGTDLKSAHVEATTLGDHQSDVELRKDSDRPRTEERDSGGDLGDHATPNLRTPLVADDTDSVVVLKVAVLPPGKTTSKVCTVEEPEQVREPESTMRGQKTHERPGNRKKAREPERVHQRRELVANYEHDLIGIAFAK